ncbi:MAG: hypothetical protein LBG83_07305 [Oscillospiraceae bacterium]|nr:hypothetical protein [Oscillospiraceae bacterium]
MGRLSKQIDPERLRVVHRSGSGFSQIREIVEDTRTGEQYFIITSGWTVTVTPLNVKK